MEIGISTSAPAGEDPLSYNYKNNFDLSFYVLDPEFPDQVATQIDISISSSIIGNNGELIIDIETTQFSNLFSGVLTSISIGDSVFSDPTMNVDDEIYDYQPVDDTQGISFSIAGIFNQSTQLFQVAETLEIDFFQFEPSYYPANSIPYSFWEENVLPLSLVDTVILPIVAIGAAAHVFALSSSSKITSSGKSVIEQVDNQITSTSIEIQEIIEENELVIDITRKTKEVGDFSKDMLDVHEDVISDYDTNWLNRWMKLGLGIYFALIIAVTSRLFLIYPNVIDNLFITIYTTYTAGFLIFLLVQFFLFGLKPNFLLRIGDQFPKVHILFIITGILAFIVLPLVELFQILDFRSNIFGVIDFFFLATITMGFVITSLFACYYLGKSGVSWVRILQSIFNKIRMPKIITKIIAKLLTIVFFAIIIFRLFKTTALLLTIFTTFEFANNAYLVSIAASYLKNEATGSVWIVYGLIMIFFIQTIMAIFLHLNKMDVERDKTSEPVFKVYRRLALLLLIAVISFVHLILILEGRIENLGIDSLIYPDDNVINSQDVFNIVVFVPPFKILLDSLLALGLLVTVPFAIMEMWNSTSESE